VRSLLVSGGWNPALHLFAQAGGKLLYRDASGLLKPANSVTGIHIVGSPSATPVPPLSGAVSTRGSTARQWVDLMHDVTVSDLELGLRENFASVEMVSASLPWAWPADQVRTSSPASLEIIAPSSRLRPLGTRSYDTASTVYARHTGRSPAEE